LDLDRDRPGHFVLSFDFELIWGTLDLIGPGGMRRECETERAVVVDRLLDMLARHRVPATWFVVGHLMLDRCQPSGGTKHPEIVRPQHAWTSGDWFTHDPASTETEAPTFYGRALVEKIRACATPQEIGSHSFSHVIFGDPGCSRETADSELRAGIAAARDLGIDCRSFAFPRNRVGHLDLLSAYGFDCYRGVEPTWYAEAPHWVRRLAHLWDVAIAARPPIVRASRTNEGLWNVPGSMVYLPMHGIRRFIPVAQRVRRAVKGLEAARGGGIFHLWTHPTNLVEGLEPMLAGFEAILDRAGRLRDRGDLQIATVGQMAQIAAREARSDA
jgi:peptidoglycan/xylan/chitin deacetylase (PgdA/CDA1 family)